jgi:adenylate kinase family enzyme
MTNACRRIVVIGATGSGKTTFGRALACRAGLAFCDLDDLYWLPGWQARAEEDFSALARAASAKDGWVICGNYARVRADVWGRADAIVWLDFPFHLVFRRLLARSLRRIADRTPVCGGNTESLKNLFSRQSIMIWLFKSYWRHKRGYGAIFADAGLYPHAAYIRLASPAAAEKFLHSRGAAS